MRIQVGEMAYDARVTGPEDGPPVLLLHGFPQTSQSWAAVTDRLVAAGHRCIAPDQRGYSPGARPDGVDAYSMEAIVDDTIGILDALGVESADVVGHDWGSNVAWMTASWYPGRVRTLTAVSVPHPRAYGWAMANDAEQQQKGAYIKLFLLPGGAAEEVLLAEDARRLRRIFAGGDLPDETVEHYVQTLSRPGALTAALNWYRAAFAGARSNRPLGPITAPTTFVWSTGDVAIGRVAAERCAEHVEGDYRFVELDGVSHWIPEQAPDALAEAILSRTS